MGWLNYLLLYLVVGFVVGAFASGLRSKDGARPEGSETAAMCLLGALFWLPAITAGVVRLTAMRFETWLESKEKDKGDRNEK